MGTPSLERVDEVFVLRLGDDENVTSHTWLDGIHACLDEVDAAEGPKALVTVGAGEKHYSTGLDTVFMGENPGETMAYVQRVQALLARLLIFGTPTVAAVNGHAFGAGAFLILAQDHAVMREDRGFVCWPEVSLGMPFTDGLIAMVRDLLPTRTAHESVVTGRRYGGPDAVAAGIVTATAPPAAVLDDAIAMAAGHATTAGSNLSAIKRSLHATTHETLLAG